MYGYGYSYPNNPQGNGLLGRYEAGVRSDGGSFAFPIDTGLASRLEGLGLLNASSLVNSCNAGKESVLYNLVPTPVQALDRFTVSRAGTKWVLGANGLLTGVQANFPAFEYNADGTYRGLSVEPGATNLLQRSQDFDNVYWTKNTSTISANAINAPDGTLTADKLVGDNLATIASIERLTAGVTASVAHTVSIFYNSSEADWIRLVASAVTGTSPARVWFNASTGAIGTNNGGFSRVLTTNYGNGWYRAEATFITSATNITVVFGLADADNSNNFVGNGTDGAFIWGAQLETGSVATSYIPTVASTANRVADSVTLTGASSLIGQTEGGIFVKVNTRLTAGGAGKRILVLSDGTANNRIQIIKSTTDRIDCVVTVGGVTQANMVTATNRSGVFIIGARYKLNDFALYVNGASIDTDTVGTAPTCSQVNLGCGLSGGEEFNDNIEYMFLLRTAPTNAQLTALTTL